MTQLSIRVWTNRIQHRAYHIKHGTLSVHVLTGRERAPSANYPVSSLYLVMKRFVWINRHFPTKKKINVWLDSTRLFFGSKDSTRLLLVCTLTIVWKSNVFSLVPLSHVTIDNCFEKVHNHQLASTLWWSLILYE